MPSAQGSELLSSRSTGVIATASASRPISYPADFGLDLGAIGITVGSGNTARHYATATMIVRQLREVGHTNTEFGGLRARLDVLLVEGLVDEMHSLTESIDDSAKSAEKQAAALVTWTKAYVGVTIAIVLATVANVVVTLMGR